MFTPVEEALQRRVGELLPKFKDRSPSLGDLLDEAAKLPALPAIPIAYDGYKPLTQTGADAKVESTWLLAIAVASSAQAGAAQRAKGEALALADTLLKGLLGWRPAKGYSRFTLAPAGGPLWLPKRGLYLLPVAVTTTHTLTGVEED